MRSLASSGAGDYTCRAGSQLRSGSLGPSEPARHGGPTPRARAGRRAIQGAPAGGQGGLMNRALGRSSTLLGLVLVLVAACNPAAPAPAAAPASAPAAGG